MSLMLKLKSAVDSLNIFFFFKKKLTVTQLIKKILLFRKSRIVINIMVSHLNPLRILIPCSFTVV